MKRAAWQQMIRQYAAADLVFVDETGATVNMTRRYARAPRQQRAIGRVPRNHGPRTTLVAALSVAGLSAPQTRRGAMNTAAFVAYVREILCPTLRPGQVVVVDNLSAHKAAAVRPLIEARQCILLFLPPYSPDFTPIELAFSKIKEALRAAGARLQTTLDDAIGTAIAQVTPTDAKGWFHHCGYSLAQS